ncbi:MAG: glycoside hydrolase family 92 protein [Bacteroidales bacterium]|nr:glycoside hydrolase family 92 protein [Bacteroidales bacterium]
MIVSGVERTEASFRRYTFEVKAPRKRADYINPKEVRFNGKLLKDRKLSHKDLMQGGILEFKMTK